MHSTLRFTLIIAIAGLIIAGCSGHNSQPITPDETSSPQDLTGNAVASNDPGVNSHYLLAYGFINVDVENPDGPKIEVIPVRDGEIHFNVLKFLEGAPCYDCFRIMGFNFPGPGYQYLNIDIRIDHPFSDLMYSVFDVRTIIMFNGSHEYPSIGKTISDPVIGEGSLLNAEGYTALFNGSTLTAPVGDFQKYFPGKLSTQTVPNSDINGFIYFRTDDPLNNRNAFCANTFDVNAFSMKLPVSQFVIGYAVDASWAVPIETPVDDPLTDFGSDANCLEPWSIVVSEEPIGQGLTDMGDQTKLLIDVYDWQGKSTHHVPVVECPELFNGQLTAEWVSDGSDHARYEVVVSNTKLAPVGDYDCLIGVEANENDPVGKPWLDLTAYQLQILTVVEKIYVNPVAIAKADPNPQFENYPVSLSGSDSYDPDGGTIQLFEWDWNNDGTYEETGEEIEHAWNEVGTYYVQLRVTDEEGQTDTLEELLEINISLAGQGDLLWAKRAGGGSDDIGYASTALSDDSTVVTGYFYYSATFGPGEPNETVLTSAGGNDIFIARYNPDGTLAWAKLAGGGFDDLGYAITTLSDNSTVVTGYFYYSATFGPGEPNETVLTSVEDDDIFIARYNPDGTLVWAKRAGGGSYDVGRGITTLSDNSTALTGWFEGSAIFGPGEPNETVLTTDGEDDIFIARYNPDGTLAWAKRAGGEYWDDGFGIKALSDNSTVVTGYFEESATFGPGEPNETILTSDGESDIFIARYNPDGTLAWAKRAGGASDHDVGYVITALSDNSAVVTGGFQASATFGPGEPNQTVLTSIAGQDIFVARYNPDGTLEWAKRAGGTSVDSGDDECGSGITLLSDNSVVVTGEFHETATFGPGEPNETVLITNDYDDIFIARYNPDGTLVWAKRAGGAEWDDGFGITALSDNSIVVTGDFEESATFGLGEPNKTVLTSDGDQDIFVARFAP
ncbi:MAG: PKD domain-containing protein [bacterium]|nr:PKD domain-containing protein [bacterium]